MYGKGAPPEEATCGQAGYQGAKPGAWTWLPYSALSAYSVK